MLLYLSFMGYHYYSLVKLHYYIYLLYWTSVLQFHHQCQLYPFFFFEGVQQNLLRWFCFHYYLLILVRCSSLSKQVFLEKELYCEQIAHSWLELTMQRPLWNVRVLLDLNRCLQRIEWSQSIYQCSKLVNLPLQNRKTAGVLSVLPIICMCLTG